MRCLCYASHNGQSHLINLKGWEFKIEKIACLTFPWYIVLFYEDLKKMCVNSFSWDPFHGLLSASWIGDLWIYPTKVRTWLDPMKKEKRQRFSTTGRQLAFLTQYGPFQTRGSPMDCQVFADLYRKVLNPFTFECSNVSLVLFSVEMTTRS